MNLLGRINLDGFPAPRRGCAPTAGGSPPRRAGFTLVEMLVVTAIIVVLLTILIVALSRAARVSQQANTTFLLGSIKQGMETFRKDHGYLPPVLDAGRNFSTLPDPDAGGFADQLQDWYSVTSVAEYLLGYGDRSQDGYGLIGSPTQSGQFPNSPGFREQPTLGFRSPGPDGVWGALLNPRANFPPNGSLASRNLPSGFGTGGGLAGNNDLIQGKVYGPYIDLKEARTVASLNTATGAVSLPGEPGYDETSPRVLVDYWGQPIRYYRRLHYPGDPKSVDARANLGDVFALRPTTVRPGEDADGLADAGNDTTTTRALQVAEFALLSPGADRSLTPLRRFDADGFNADNIVEVGP
ncbi:MAG: type II secretion system protein [Phycisphaerales bacterium]|nr:type II secretion system protein [Phycisphaerales bacterium]